MLELKGLDAMSALAELARQPDLSRLLGVAWAPAIQSAVEAALAAEIALRSAMPSQALRDLLASSSLAVMQPAMIDALEASAVPAMSPAQREAMESLALSTGVLADMGRAMAPMTDAINATAGVDSIARSLPSPAIAELTRDLGRYDDVARLARQAVASLPPGIVREVARDE